MINVRTEPEKLDIEIKNSLSNVSNSTAIESGGNGFFLQEDYFSNVSNSTVIKSVGNEFLLQEDHSLQSELGKKIESIEEKSENKLLLKDYCLIYLSVLGKGIHKVINQPNFKEKESEIKKMVVNEMHKFIMAASVDTVEKDSMTEDMLISIVNDFILTLRELENKNSLEHFSGHWGKESKNESEEKEKKKLEEPKEIKVDDTQSVKNSPDKAAYFLYQAQELGEGMIDGVLRLPKLVLHPITTLQGIYTTVRHPLNTAGAFARTTYNRPVRTITSMLVGGFMMDIAGGVIGNVAATGVGAMENAGLASNMADIADVAEVSTSVTVADVVTTVSDVSSTTIASDIVQSVSDLSTATLDSTPSVSDINMVATSTSKVITSTSEKADIVATIVPDTITSTPDMVTVTPTGMSTHVTGFIESLTIRDAWLGNFVQKITNKIPSNVTSKTLFCDPIKIASSAGHLVGEIIEIAQGKEQKKVDEPTTLFSHDTISSKKTELKLESPHFTSQDKEPSGYLWSNLPRLSQAWSSLFSKNIPEKKLHDYTELEIKEFDYTNLVKKAKEEKTVDIEVNGKTALHLAIEKQQFNKALILINIGEADINKKNKAGQDAFALAENIAKSKKSSGGSLPAKLQDLLKLLTTTRNLEFSSVNSSCYAVYRG